MHIRRTDYGSHLDELYKLKLVGRQYLANATDRFRKKFKVKLGNKETLPIDPCKKLFL